MYFTVNDLKLYSFSVKVWKILYKLMWNKFLLSGYNELNKAFTAPVNLRYQYTQNYYHSLAPLYGQTSGANPWASKVYIFWKLKKCSLQRYIYLIIGN